MTTRKDLVREYKERRKPAGVFMVKNVANGKVLLGSSLNLEGSLNREQFTLRLGSHRNQALQQDWRAFGEESFSFEVLETVAASDAPDFDLEDELTLLEQLWLEKLQPFGDRGYNRGPKIRQA